MAPQDAPTDKAVFPAMPPPIPLPSHPIQHIPLQPKPAPWRFCSIVTVMEHVEQEGVCWHRTDGGLTT